MSRNVMSRAPAMCSAGYSCGSPTWSRTRSGSSRCFASHSVETRRLSRGFAVLEDCGTSAPAESVTMVTTAAMSGLNTGENPPEAAVTRGRTCADDRLAAVPYEMATIRWWPFVAGVVTELSARVPPPERKRRQPLPCEPPSYRGQILSRHLLGCDRGRRGIGWPRKRPPRAGWDDDQGEPAPRRIRGGGR